MRDTNDILDDGIYFTKEEEAAYDQGFHEGFEAGMLQRRFASLMIALGFGLLLFAIFGK